MINMCGIAMEYAQMLGWAVLPIKPKDKVPLTEHGCKDATKDLEVIEKWWKRWPDANIGIATGKASGLVVLDIDPRHNGDRNIGKILSPTTKTVKARTGSGGQHWYFAYPLDKEEVKNKVNILPGIDLRGDGGYVVAPPSIHQSGQRYLWTFSPKTTLLAPFSLDSEPKGEKIRQQAGKLLTEGERNDALARMAGAMRRRGMTEEAIFKGIMIENAAKCSPPLDEREVEKIARSIAQYEPEKKNYHLTDLGNAERLRDRYASTIRYCHSYGTWFIWNQTRFKRDEMGCINQLAVHTVKNMFSEAEALPEEKRKKLMKWALRSEDRTKVQAMIAMCQSLERIPITPAEMDTNPWLLNCLDGTVDLTTGLLREHQPEDLITKVAPCNYNDPNEDAEKLWRQFLERMVPNDETRAFLRRAVGYTITGVTHDEVLFFVHGPTAAGKSTFAEAIKTMMGDYAITANFETFLHRRDVGTPRPGLAKLVGMRYVPSIEVEEGRQLAEELIKWIVGGDTITTRFCHKNEFEYTPQFKLWLVANRKPEVQNPDAAFWRRIYLIPFTVSLPEAERNPEVKAMLRDAGFASSAILKWAVRGCLEWQEQGLCPPKEVISATEAYRAEMDPLADWIGDRCSVEPFCKLKATDAWDSYEMWRVANQMDMIKKRKFQQLMDSRGFTYARDKHGRFYAGIRLKTNEELGDLPF